MKKKQKKIQIALISIGVLLILMTYFYYPYINKFKLAKNQSNQKDLGEVFIDKSTSFENVEYKGLYADSPFTIKSKEAYILDDEDPDLLHMKNMRVVIYLNDGRVVTIVSDEGRYNKRTYDMFFEKNVFADDGGTTEISSDNLNMLAEKDVVEIFNNVNLVHVNGSLKADHVEYSFTSKYFVVSNFDDEDVKVKVIK